MASLEIFNVTPVICYQPGVAERAAFVADGREIDSSVMFHVAIDAGKLLCGIGVVDRTVVAGEASGVGGLSGELAGLLQVAGRALFFWGRVGGAAAPALKEASCANK